MSADANNIDFELTPIEISSDLPSVSHWQESRREIEQVKHELNAYSQRIACLIDRGYNGAAHTRLQSAEHALREAVMQLHIASGIML
jgi:hypothetical protein